MQEAKETRSYPYIAGGPGTDGGGSGQAEGWGPVPAFAETPEVTLRRATVQESALHAGESAASQAIGWMRSRLAEAGGETYGSLKFKTVEERDQYRAVMKSRFNILTQQLLADL